MPTKVSIVIPVYNHECYIRECVESALAQDYEDLEVIVVDDGSTDGTPEILAEFGQRIRMIRQTNQGTAAALNAGLRSARGSLIGWLSSDDLYLPGKITAQVERFMDNSSLSLVYTDWVKIDAQGRDLGLVEAPCPSPERMAMEILTGNFINGSSVLVQKRCFHEVGYFDETLATDSDGDMWLRMLKNGCTFGHVPVPLVKYRWHSGNLSHKVLLHQSCKDAVRLRALESFSAKDLFGSTLEPGQRGMALAYERLAFTLARQMLFQSAHFALGESLRCRLSIGNVVWRILFGLLRLRALRRMMLFLRRAVVGFRGALATVKAFGHRSEGT